MPMHRPAFNEPGFPTQTIRTNFGDVELTLPKFDTPITPKENFIRAAKRDNPLWVPNHYTDHQLLYINEFGTDKLGKRQLGPDFKLQSQVDYDFIDPFGNSWTWVASAGGAMLTPGTKMCDDICDWEKAVKWPDFEEWTIRETAEAFMREKYDPAKVMHLNLHQGLTEQLVAMLGGYGEGMTAMAEEPEACLEFFNSCADFIIRFFDYMKSLYPVDFITYHDDWGTERAAFFSSKMFENLIQEPTQRIIDHIKGAGCIFELHTCGNVEQFIPYACDMGVDFLQIQRRAVNIPKMKELYGDRIGFNPMIENYDIGTNYSEKEIVEKVRKTVDLYAKGGGCYPWIFETNPELAWILSSELYCYSSEYYAKG